MEVIYADFQKDKGRKLLAPKYGIKIMERDNSIFKFLLDMKFASREAIADKFFWSKDQKSESKSELRTRDRLYILQQHNWIVPIQFPGDPKNYFQATWKAYYHILKLFPNDTIPKPSGKPDYETVDHDLLVLKSRVHLERYSKIKNWISDKTIRTIMGDFSIASDYFAIPDGIYETASGEKVGFEFERVQKSKTQYREKLKALNKILRSRSKSSLEFTKVHFVCLTNAGYKFLKEETKIYGDLFLIERSADFFNTKLT